jgi:hypothetical protein
MNNGIHVNVSRGQNWILVLSVANFEGFCVNFEGLKINTIDKLTNQNCASTIDPTNDSQTHIQIKVPFIYPSSHP